MKSLNRVELKGSLGSDPKINTVEGGRRVANLSVATDYPWQDREGKWQHDTDWHNVVAWEGYGIVDLNTLRKGAKVYVSGRLRTRKFTDRSGVERTITEIVAEDLDILEAEQPRQQSQKANPQRGQKPAGDDDF